MKLALVTETFPPEINGVAMTLGRLAGGLALRGHDVHVIRPRQRGETTVEGTRDARGLRHHLVPGLPIPGYPLLRLGLPAGRRLARLWREERPDLVHVATEGPLGYSALGAARRRGLRVASSFHTNFHAYSRHYGFPALRRASLAYLRFFHNRADCTLSPTHELNRALAADGFKNLGLLSRGVDTRLFSPAKRSQGRRASWGAGPETPVVLHVSRLAPEKNYPLVFESFAAFRRLRPEAKLVLVGDGPLRTSLSQAHPWAHFTGFLPEEELAECYASADVFFYASLTETFGNVVTEAMASGLALVAYDYAAARLFLRSGENGLLVPCGGEEAFLAAAASLADLARARRLGAAARTTAESISWEAVVRQFERDLSALAEGKEPSSSRTAAAVEA